MLESIQSVGERNHVDLADNPSYNSHEVSVDVSGGLTQNVNNDAHPGELVQHDMEGSEQELGNRSILIPDVQRGNQSFVRTSDSRSSVRSESRLLYHRTMESEPDNAKSQFSRQMSTRMSTRSEAGILSNKSKFVSIQQPNSKASLKQANWRTYHQEAAGESFHAESSMEPIKKFSIHQVQSPTQLDDSKIPVDGLTVKINSPYGDIPSFKDPELTGEGDDIKNDTILIPPPPPDIYSSQILNTDEPEVESNENSCYTQSSLRSVGETTNLRERFPNRIISIEQPVVDYSDGM